MDSKAARAGYCRCLFYSASALARHLARLADDCFAVTGLAPSHAFLLMAVNEHPGIQPSELAEVLMLAPSTITRLVDKLEAKGFLVREVAGKICRIRPTAKARELDARIRAAWLHLFEQYSHALEGTPGSPDALADAVYEAAVRLEKVEG